MKTTRWIVLTCTLAAAACAAFSPGPREPESVIAVRVENDLTSRLDVTVRIVAVNGSSRLLGGVGPGGDQTLDFRERRFAGSYTLTATTSKGDVIASRSFNLFPGATVRWQLRLNQIRVIDTGTGGSAP